MGEVLVKVLSILSMVFNFLNEYMGEALVKGVVNFINVFFVKRGFKIHKWVHG